MCEEELFERYVQICNTALEANKNKFPFAQILSAIQKTPNIKPKQVRIINDTGHPDYHVAFNNNGMSCKKTCGSCQGQCATEDDIIWSVKTSYLNEVIANPDKYIENPAKLNWEWITLK